jgi:hypothetical protein
MYTSDKRRRRRRRRGIEFIRQVVRVPFSIDVNAADCLCAAQRQEKEEELPLFLLLSRVELKSSLPFELWRK